MPLHSAISAVWCEIWRPPDGAPDQIGSLAKDLAGARWTASLAMTLAIARLGRQMALCFVNFLDQTACRVSLRIDDRVVRFSESL